MEETFSQWACDSARTLEERFGAQLLIEQLTGIPVAKNEHGQSNYEAEQLWRKERAFNPAWRPDYTREQAAAIEENLPTLTRLHVNHDDRAVRNLSFLRFCPAMEDLHLGHPENCDWTPVAGLLRLKSLWLTDRQSSDYRSLGCLSELESIYIYGHCPWPDFSGWEGMRQLKKLTYHGNPLALSSIPSLPSVRTADIVHWNSFTVPLRSLHDLPEMPELRSLKLINTWKLDGIERYPELVNLEIYGYYDDIAPLASLQKLTHLFISGGTYEDLHPLLPMQELRWLKVRREEPLDYTPLTDLAHLHEVEVELCPVNKMEVAALNAGLTPWDEIFALPHPRPLAPLRLLLDRKDDEPALDARPEERDWKDNPLMATCEARWFARSVNRRLNHLLGKGWGKCSEGMYGHPGFEHVEISRSQDIDLLRDIVDSIRELVATCRFGWRVALSVDSLRQYERDMDEIDDDDDEEDTFDAERERQDFEWRQSLKKERLDYLARKHRLRLQQETGAEIRPEDFAPPPPEEEEDEEVTADGSEETTSEYDLGTELQAYLTVLERGCFVPEHSRGLAEMLLALDAEEPTEGEG